MNNKLILVICVMGIILTIGNPMVVMGEDANPIIEANTIRDLKKGLSKNEVDTLVVNNESILDSEILQEYLDDGVKILVPGDHKEEIEYAFNEDIDDVTKKKKAILGYYISADGEDNKFTSLIATPGAEKGKKDAQLSLEGYDMEMLDITNEEIIESVKKNNSLPDLSKLPRKQKHILQAGNANDSGFLNKDMTIFGYAHTADDCNSACAKKKSDVQPTGDWKKVGVFRILAYVVKGKNESQTAYDYV